MDAVLIGKDPHLSRGCGNCHKGDESANTKGDAHKGLVKRPSDDLNNCRLCHPRIAETYGKSLHYTTIGQREGVKARFSEAELKVFDQKVFKQSCRSCHASCGDCHVKSPPVSGITLGLLKGHKFVKKDEGKTCAFCHGGRVYPEYTGEYGGTPDVHYQKGMMCMDCHRKAEMHGDGTRYTAKQEVKDRPTCRGCHQPKKAAKLYTRAAHDLHADKASCSACHASGNYRDCYNCHGGHAEAKPGFNLGLNPRDKKTLTTLRLIPTVRGTFSKAGIAMHNFDALPNYWDSPVHSIRKRTDRTRSCDACHVDRKGFLTKEQLIKNGSKANEGLIFNIKPIKR